MADALDHLPPDALPGVAATLQGRYLDTRFEYRTGFRASHLSDLAAAMRSCDLDGDDWKEAARPGQSSPLGPANSDGLGPDDTLVGLPTVSLPATPMEGRRYRSPIEEKTSAAWATPPDPLKLLGSPRKSVCLREAWMTVLGGDRPPLDEAHFFEEGGNSLLAIQFIAELKGAGVLELSIADLYDTPRFGGLLNVLLQRSQPGSPFPEPDGNSEDLDEYYSTEL